MTVLVVGCGWAALAGVAYVGVLAVMVSNGRRRP